MAHLAYTMYTLYIQLYHRPLDRMPATSYVNELMT